MPLQDGGAREALPEPGAQAVRPVLQQPPLGEVPGGHGALALEGLGNDVALLAAVAHQTGTVWMLKPPAELGQLLRRDALRQFQGVSRLCNLHGGGASQAGIQLVASAEARLQVLVGADALQAAADHDAYARAEGLRFLHVVRRQHDGALLPRRGDGGDRVPHEAARRGVNTRAGLVEEHQRRRAHQRDGERELPLVAAAERHGELVHMVGQ
mmetsp:Transcript_135610/g.421310  ORF Transcript_135610/g.421310 Transcript_135610/m.421310 type:complete len:212 (+) Transcript_135610:292-927(+)